MTSVTLAKRLSPALYSSRPLNAAAWTEFERIDTVLLVDIGFVQQ